MSPSALFLFADGCQRACFESLTFGEPYYSLIECTRKILHFFFSFTFLLQANIWFPLALWFHFVNTSWRSWCASSDCPNCCRNMLEALIFLFSFISLHRHSRANEKGCVSFWVTWPSAGCPTRPLWTSLARLYQEVECISSVGQAHLPLAYTQCRTL